jgi:multiple sugar transport system substrate-binding protein
MKRSKKLAPVAVLGAIALALTACSSSTTTTTTTASGPAASGLAGRGPITYVQGKDNSNVVKPLVATWNAAHPTEKVTFKEQTDQADQQHDDLVQNFQTKNPNYDVMSVDVIWTAEFAAKGWLQPLKGKQLIDTSLMLPATVKTATYNGVMYAAPVSTDGGILYYRKDLVPTPPKTWAEMMSMCSIAKAKKIGCYAGQYFKYEGLTVNVAEAINSAGGTIVGADGKPTVTSPEAKKGLQNLVTAYADGSIPKEGITFKEEEARLAFENGNLLFLRNWPYVYNLAKTDGSSKVKTTFGMAALPGASGPGASSLGGHNAAISVYSKNKATAADFLKFLTTTEQQKAFVTQGSLAPVLTALYDDPALVAKFPYLTPLKASLQNAVPRPVTPFYPAVSKAVQDNAYAAIKGEVPVDTALANMQKAIQAAGGQ